MVDKEVEQPRVVMHTMTRTREVPEIRHRTVAQLQTVCKKVRKEVPLPKELVCPCATPTCGCQGQSNCGCAAPTCGCANEPKFKIDIVDECSQEEVPRDVEYTEMREESYQVQVPTTYVNKVTVQVPKEVTETRTVQKAFEIEVPVTKFRNVTTSVPIPNDEEAFYEHDHVGGEEAHTHGAAVDPDTVTDADPCAAHECPMGKIAFKATDGVCYCTMM